MSDFFEVIGDFEFTLNDLEDEIEGTMGECEAIVSGESDLEGLDCAGAGV